MELVKLIEFSLFEEDNGNLAVFEENYDSIPFSIKRIFNVTSQKDSIRGKHIALLVHDSWPSTVVV